MRRAVRWGLLGLLLLFAGIQLVPVDRTNPPVLSRIEPPAEVRTILERSCYDCHSNETRWPWYSRVAPASWFMANHVRHGRGDLNFSEWPALDFELQEHAMHDIVEQVGEGNMPLRSYLLLHRDAKLGPEDRETLVRWAKASGGGGDEGGAEHEKDDDGD